MPRHTDVYAIVVLLATALTLPVAQAQNEEALKQFVGKWQNASLSFTGDGRFSRDLPEQVEVKQPDRNTIEFSVKPKVTDEPVFHIRLTYDITSKSYLLDVRSHETRDYPSVLEKVKLTYTQGAGFSGEGMLTGPSGKSQPVKVQIAPKQDGWTLQATGNGLDFSIGFFERIK